MHKIAIDFDITVIFPLLAASLIFLGKSVRFLWGRGENPYLAALPAASTAILAGLFFAPDPVKVSLGAGVYEIVAIAAVLTFFVSLWCAVSGISQRERTGSERSLEVILCVVVMLVAAGGALHFVHQAENAKHVLCPHCDDSGDDN